MARYDVYHDGQFLKSVGDATLSTAVAVVPGVTWGLYVNARDAAGNVSQASATVSVIPPQCQADTTPPTTPGGIRSTAAGTGVTLTWTASTDNVVVRAYDILRDGTKVGWVTGTSTAAPATSFADSGMALVPPTGTRSSPGMHRGTRRRPAPRSRSLPGRRARRPSVRSPR